jgi:hypothetical protein
MDDTSFPCRGPDHGLSIPVGFKALVEVGVQGKAGGGPSGLIGVRWVAPGVLRVGQEPVPVEDRHVRVLAGRRVPPEEVIVMGAELARGVMVADVVVIDLGKGNAEQAEGQDDPEQTRASCLQWPSPVHGRVLYSKSSTWKDAA